MTTQTLEKPETIDLSSTSNVLVVDIDATIWDPWPWYIEAAKRITGVDVVYEEAQYYDYFFDVLGRADAIIMFDEVLAPERAMRRPWYPGCQETLRMFSRELGIELHFVSHNHNPERMYPGIHKWLRHTLGIENFSLRIGRQEDLDKVAYALEHDAFGIIDDKPETLMAAYWGPLAENLIATKMHPWNRELCLEMEIARGFDAWYEAAGIVYKYVKGIQEYA